MEKTQVEKLISRLGNQISKLVIENHALVLKLEEIEELTQALTEENESLKGGD